MTDQDDLPRDRPMGGSRRPVTVDRTDWRVSPLGWKPDKPLNESEVVRRRAMYEFHFHRIRAVEGILWNRSDPVNDEEDER
jgi:hypothetical protein